MSRKDFPWGRIVEDHEIGPYMVREYVDRLHGKTLFHGYIDGQDKAESWPSLDAALAGLIVLRSLGPEHRMISAHFITGIQALASQQ